MSEFGERKNIIDDGVEENQIESLVDLSSSEKQKKRMETKLYVVRDVDGEPNREEIEIVRELEKELSKHPAFIGVSLFGSAISGYSTNQEEFNSEFGTIDKPDLDLYVLYDLKKFSEDQDVSDFYSLVKEIIFDIVRKHHKEIDVKKMGINRKEIIEGIRLLPTQERNTSTEIDLAVMSRVISGETINEIREEVKVELRNLSVLSRTLILKKIVDNLVERDILSLKKRKKRMPKLSEEQHREILEKRKKMWRKRVQKIWGIGEIKE